MLLGRGLTLATNVPGGRSLHADSVFHNLNLRYRGNYNKQHCISTSCVRTTIMTSGNTIGDSNTPKPLLSLLQRPPSSERLRPQIRSSVLKLLSQRLSTVSPVPKKEDALINLIIMEYFEWIGYLSSNNMILKESSIDYASILDRGQSVTALVRRKFKLDTSEDDIPVLLTLIAGIKK